MECIIYKIASIGSPTQPELRAPVLGKVIEKKWIWSSIVGNLAVSVFGFVSFHYKGSYYECHDVIAEYNANYYYSINEDDFFSKFLGRRVWWFALILLLTSQMMELFLSSVALGSFLRQEKAIAFIGNNYYDIDNDMVVSEHSLHGPRYNQHHHALAEEMWDTRCRSFCKCAAFSTCYLFGGRELVDGVVGDYAQISRGKNS